MKDNKVNSIVNKLKSSDIDNKVVGKFILKSKLKTKKKNTDIGNLKW